MLNRFCDGVSGVVTTLSWMAFAALIITVALQVIARNILQLPMIWTGDLALLLFTWLIFIGAATGLRTGAHYVVDLLPMHRPPVRLFASIIAILAGTVVAWLLGTHGLTLARMRASGEIQSLGISRLWIYLALPVSGYLMALYILEMAVDLFRDPMGRTTTDTQSRDAL